MIDKTEQFVQVFRVLSDSTRFELLNLLLTHDLCVGALARRLKISEAAVSQHLKQLREAGLVKGEKRGYWTHYMVEKHVLSDLAQGLTGLTDLQSCSQEVCSRNLSGKSDAAVEGLKMCDCACRHSEKPKGKTGKCTSEQKGCHGDG